MISYRLESYTNYITNKQSHQNREQFGTLTKEEVPGVSQGKLCAQRQAIEGKHFNVGLWCFIENKDNNCQSAEINRAAEHHHVVMTLNTEKVYQTQYTFIKHKL